MLYSLFNNFAIMKQCYITLYHNSSLYLASNIISIAIIIATVTIVSVTDIIKIKIETIELVKKTFQEVNLRLIIKIIHFSLMKFFIHKEAIFLN